MLQRGGRVPEIIVRQAVQAEVSKREREIQAALNETAESRNGYKAFNDAAAPYAAMIQADGSNPLRAFQTLLQSAAVLRTGPEGTRVKMLANMIKAFLPSRASWEALDAELTGQAPAAGQQPQQEFRDPRLDPLLQRLEQAERANQQAAQQRNADIIEDLSKEEFWEDVKDDVADILEMHARRGLTITARDAYTRAVAINPGTSPVVAQREAAKRANPSGSTAAARRAAGSVRGSPAAAIRKGGEAASLREDLEDSFENALSR
jgi:hypothetical protein